MALAIRVFDITERKIESTISISGQVTDAVGVGSHTSVKTVRAKQSREEKKIQTSDEFYDCCYEVG